MAFAPETHLTTMMKQYAKYIPLGMPYTSHSHTHLIIENHSKMH